MKLFISWSGKRSRVVAEALHNWIPDVIHAVQPWMSSADIDPGARWSEDIIKELQATHFGIICLTPENLNASWLLFESGAMANSVNKILVCPYLVDLELKSLVGPLLQFQGVQASKDGTFDLLRSINQRLAEDSLSEDRLRRSFECWWPELQKTLQSLPEDMANNELLSFSASHLGLESVHQTRAAALEAFAPSLNLELERALQTKDARIWIVASSFNGFHTQALQRFDGKGFLERLAISPIDFRLMLTHPNKADFRAQQESRNIGDIQKETTGSIAILKNVGISREQVRYYPGTPTVFAIATTNKMLLNPYPYESDSRRCFSLITHVTDNDKDIFHQYLENHFQKPWQRANEVPQADWEQP